MNEELQSYARSYILDGLSKLPEHNRTIFRMMYGRNNGKRSLELSLGMSLEDVVKEIPSNKLDWAMQQIKNTLVEYDFEYDFEDIDNQWISCIIDFVVSIN